MKCTREYVNCEYCGKRIYEIEPLYIAKKKMFCSAECAFKYCTKKKLKRTIFNPDLVSAKDRHKVKTHTFEYDLPSWLGEDLDD